MQEEDNKEMAQIFAGNEKFAADHLKVINMFGRYPTRNKILGRESTAEEKIYLQGM